MERNSDVNSRLEAFCDGVFAIAITLLILDIRIPPLESVHSVTDLWMDIGKLWPSFFALCFSFVIILISWLGHHNLLQRLDKTSPQFQLANGFFMFTVIIIPFPTSFMAEYLNTPYAQPAVVVYSLCCLLHNVGWNVLHRYVRVPARLTKPSTNLAEMKKSEQGAHYGFLLYSALAILAWWFPRTAISINAVTWIYWLYLSISLK